MSFFNKEPKQTDMPLDSCEGHLKKLFESYSASVNSRATLVTTKLLSNLDSFQKAINEFSNVKAEPDEELAGTISVSFIKKQKPKYEESLSFAVSLLREQISAINRDTKYEELREFQLHFADFVSKILSLNSNFRGVIMGYSDEMRFFKKPFSVIEKSLKDLEYELSRGEEVFRFYIALKDEIKKLLKLKNELYIMADVTDNDAKNTSNNTSPIKAEIRTIENKISELQEEASKAEHKYHKTSAEVELLLKPLERAARKYDHANAGKQSIAKLLSNPMAELSNELAYSHFISMLNDMKSKIKDKTISVDNEVQVIEQINDVLNSGINSSISEANSSIEDKQSIEREILGYKNVIYDLNKKLNNIESESKIIDQKIKNSAEIKKMIEDTKYSIERMFMQYYNSKVHIKE